MNNKIPNVTIGTISGGIVNFGGAVCISPISITKTVSGSGENNTTSGETEDSAIASTGNGNSNMNSSNQQMNNPIKVKRAMRR